MFPLIRAFRMSLLPLLVLPLDTTSMIVVDHGGIVVTAPSGCPLLLPITLRTAYVPGLLSFLRSQAVSRSWIFFALPPFPPLLTTVVHTTNVACIFGRFRNVYPLSTLVPLAALVLVCITHLLTISTPLLRFAHGSVLVRARTANLV